MTKGLRKHLNQLPYFLLFNYPKKMKTYLKSKEKNKHIDNPQDKIKSNAYHSPSPMNELCDYICTWEKKNILWDNQLQDLIDTRCLIINNDLALDDKNVLKIARRYVNLYADELRKHLNMNKSKDKSDSDDYRFAMDKLVERYKQNLQRETDLSEELIANYVIKVSYGNFSISKSLAWSAYGDYIIKNLKTNSNPQRNISITEVPYQTNNSYEYLGKFYEFKEADVL